MDVLHKIIDQETKLVELGYEEYKEYYLSKGFTYIGKDKLEQAYTGEYYLAGHAPQPVAPTIEEQNEVIRQTRSSLYASLIDPLNNEKLRKEVLGEWAPELEAEYQAKVIELSNQIREQNPYLTESEVMENGL